MTYGLIYRFKNILSYILPIWFVLFSVLLNASHYHSSEQFDCIESPSHCHSEQQINYVSSDNALLLANTSIPDKSTSSFSSICFVCLLLASLNFEYPLTPPVPILSDTKTIFNLFKPISIVTSPDLSQNSPRSPPC